MQNGQNIGTLLAEAAERFGEREAIRFGGDSVSFREVRDRAEAVAQALSRHGVKRGEHVGLLVPDGLEGISALLGVMALGAVAVPINGRFKSDELHFILNHADIRALICGDDESEGYGYRRLLRGLLRGGEGKGAFPRYPMLRFVAGLGDGLEGDVDLSSDAGSGPLEFATDEDDVALILYTSGTTARPKGCMHRHAALVRHAPNALGSVLGVGAADRVFCPLPMFHAGGIVTLLGCLALGATFCHSGRFAVEPAIAFLRDERCTVAYAPFEAIWGAICTRLEAEPVAFPDLRVAVYCVPPERMRLAQSVMPSTSVVGAYGSTESCINLTMASPEDSEDKRLATVGRAVEGMEVRVVDPETRRALPHGQRGELAFRGYARFLGYYKEKDLTAAVIDGDGWFYSGDFATLDADGFVTFNGRLKDMLKVGGENVAAIEIEGFLARHEAIAMVQVIGVPDERYGEVPAAFVQLRDGARLTEAELQAYCIGKIATYKVPRYLRVVTAWPMSGTKVKKFELRAGLIAELQRAGVRSAPKMSSKDFA